MSVISFKEISDGRDAEVVLGRRGTVRKYIREQEDRDRQQSKLFD